MSLSNILKIFLIFRDLSLTDSYKIYSYKKNMHYFPPSSQPFLIEGVLGSKNIQGVSKKKVRVLFC